MGNNKLCFGCMEEKGNVPVCPFCGYRDDTPCETNYLAPGTVLNDRYLIGRVLSSNGEGVTYIAFDQVLSCKVSVREYLPDVLCSRVKGTSVVNVDPRKLAQYKTLMSEFTELHKQLAKLRTLSHIAPSLNIFAQNNTSYVVFEYIEGMTLKAFVKDNAGELSWQQVSKLFPPLFTTLNMLHNAGVVHRGISLDTIYVTKSNELKLTGFSIAAVRTANSELTAELYGGYAAPEQYSSSNWQGTWTDVYAISAVLYRVLTGCMPTEAVSRLSSDNLCPPIEINASIPRNVSRVIMDGMHLTGESRIQNMNDLVTKLFEQPVRPAKTEAAAPTPAEPIKPKKEAAPVQVIQSTPQVTAFERIKVPLMVGVLLLATLMVIAIIAIELLDINGSSSSALETPLITTTYTTSETTVSTTTAVTTETTIGGAKCTMNNLCGKIYEEIVNSPTYIGFVVFERVDMYDTEYEKGQICWQEVEPGDYYIKGSTVKIGVSCGPSEVEVPSYSGKSRTEYLDMLAELGITNITTTAWDNTGKTAGLIVNTSIEPGEKISIKNDENLIVYYAAPSQTTATTAPVTDAVTESETTVAVETTTHAESDSDT